MADRGRHTGRATADAAFLTALAGGSTITDAADQAGISPRTAWRRLDDPDFRGQVDQARAATVQAATDALSKASRRAVRTLIALMSTRQRPTVRLAAARAVLELGGRYREANDLEARLSALEAALLAQRPHNGRRA